MVILAGNNHQRAGGGIQIEAGICIEQLGIDGNSRVRRSLLVQCFPWRGFGKQHSHHHGDRCNSGRNGRLPEPADPPRRRRFFGQDALDALADRGRASHCHTEEWLPRESCHVEQDRRIAGTVAQRLDRGVVARQFGKLGEPPVQPPG